VYYHILRSLFAQSNPNAGLTKMGLLSALSSPATQSEVDWTAPTRAAFSTALKTTVALFR